jgi:hypothetical protein
MRLENHGIECTQKELEEGVLFPRRPHEWSI